MLAIVVATWALLQLWYPYLGHDEAVYASQARHWAEGVPAVGWRSYRPVGLPALGAVVLWLAPGTVPDALVLRAFTLVAALGYVALSYLLARRWTGPYPALVVVAVLIGGVTFLRRLPEFLNDIGAAALLLGVTFQILRARSEPGRMGSALTGAAVLAVAACVLRYGAISGLLAIVLAAVFTWGLRTWWRSASGLTGAMTVVGLAILVAAVAGQRSTGTPWGVFLAAGQAAHRQYIGDGVVFYLRAFPWLLAGPLGGILMVVGVLGAGLSWRRRHVSRPAPVPEPGPAPESGPAAEPDADLGRVFLAIAALLHLLLLGMSAHGESRFALFPIAVLTVLGVDTLTRVPRPWGPALLAGVVVAVPPAGLASLAAVWRYGQVTTAARQPLVEAMRNTPVDGPCLVVTPLIPETGWVTDCRVTGTGGMGTVPTDTTVLVLHREGHLNDPDPGVVSASLSGRGWTTERLVTGPDGQRVLVSRFPGSSLPEEARRG
jgi:hypothetical protein